MSEQAVYVEGELFVGRLDEQDYFRGVLRAVLDPQDDDAYYKAPLRASGTPGPRPDPGTRRPRVGAPGLGPGVAARRLAL